MRWSFPGLPGRSARRPKFVQVLVLAVSVHRMEEPFGSVGHQLLVACKTFQRLPLKDAIVAFQVVEDLSIKNEEARTGPALELRLLNELAHAPFLVKLEHPITRERMNCGDGGHALVSAMKVDDGANVEVSQAIPIGHEKGVISYVLFDSLEAPARHGLGTGFGKCDLEVLLAVRVVVGDLVLTTEADGEVIVHRFIVEEVLLDHLAAVAEAEHKVTETVMRV